MITALDWHASRAHHVPMSQPLLPPTPLQLRAFGDADGAVIAHAGRYAREAVLLAFEMIGGVDRLADWAGKNPDLFYTRLFPKVISREVEVTASAGVEDLLRKLDSGGAPPAQDADYEVIDE